MSIAKWILIGVYALSTLIYILTIGKPRKPTNPGDAVAVAIINAIFVWLVIIA